MLEMHEKPGFNSWVSLFELFNGVVALSMIGFMDQSVYKPTPPRIFFAQILISLRIIRNNTIKPPSLALNYGAKLKFARKYSGWGRLINGLIRFHSRVQRLHAKFIFAPLCEQ